MTEFITVATFNFSHEITILKTILDHEEIPYLFQNENLISIDPLANCLRWHSIESTSNRFKQSERNYRRIK
jgi:hypothetical protein